MIEIRFKTTSEGGEGGEPREVIVCIHEPVRNPPDAEWPWAARVDVDGRSYTTYGVDPLDAIDNASMHAAILLHSLYDKALDPPVEPRSLPEKKL